MSKPRLIAFYLPQFYPTEENDQWWQKGFTEWINVGKAKPLFRGHYQPKVPADLGYYDLRVPEIREQQAFLAKEAGIEGFCYWHYWFAGRRLLNRVFDEVVESEKPNFPFCLCWANHSWYQKTWSSDKPDKMLIEQTYLGKDDYIAHFNAMLPAFKDKRYMRINGKLIFGIYSPLDIPDFALFKQTWNRLAEENNIGQFHFFGFNFNPEKAQEILNNGYDSSVIDYVLKPYHDYRQNIIRRGLLKLRREYFKIPKLLDYNIYISTVLKEYNSSKGVYPSIDPNFDHSPRSGARGVIIPNSTPELWYDLCRKVFEKSIFRAHDENLIFIKAWNEWGEGNYLEPDLKYGRKYIDVLRKAIDEFE